MDEPSATPAQVANDMRAHARLLQKSDQNLASLCRDAAKTLDDMLAGEKIDGRRWHGLHGRLLTFEGPRSGCYSWNVTRARLALEALRRGETA